MGGAFGSNGLCLITSFLKVCLRICTDSVPCPGKAGAEGGYRAGTGGRLLFTIKLENYSIEGS